MNKEDWLWIIIRGFGVYLLVLAIVALPDAISSFYTAKALFPAGFDASVTYSGDEPEFTKNVRSTLVIASAKSMAKAIAFTLASIYFLRFGRLLHRLLARE